jgi:hypothetical protein
MSIVLPERDFSNLLLAPEEEKYIGMSRSEYQALRIQRIEDAGYTIFNIIPGRMPGGGNASDEYGIRIFYFMETAF